MANDLTHNPWSFDTVGTAPQVAGRVKVQAIRWASATTAGHVCEIVDADNRTLWYSVASGANYVEAEETFNRWWNNGFFVKTLGSGTVFIHYE